MTPNEYLDAAKKILETEADHGLAKKLDVNPGTICGIREGKRGIPVEVAFKLAITLNLDPALVVADLESQRKGSGKQGEFWRGFLSRAAMIAALVCTLAFNFSAMSGNERARLGGLFRRNQYA